MRIGYEHELKIDKELKLGLSFDFTTGQPYIPGSSIKGVLRQAFRDKAFVQYASNKAGIHTEGIDWENWKMIFLRALPMKNKNLNAPIKQMCSLMLLLLAHTREMIRRYYQMIV